MRNLLILLMLPVMLLSGCAQFSADLESSRAKLAKFTVDDLDAAIVIAKSANDLEAMQCYPVLRDKIANRKITAYEVKGLVSAFEAARVKIDVVTNLGNSADLREINLACAALVTDVSNTIVQLGLMIK